MPAIACLQLLTDLFAERRQQLARSVGLSDQQWAALEEISSEHFMPSLFARQRESSAAAVSKILRQLLHKDLVSVRLGVRDGRPAPLSADRQGQALHRGLAPRAGSRHLCGVEWIRQRRAGRLHPFRNPLAQRLTNYAESVKERK